MRRQRDVRSVIRELVAVFALALLLTLAPAWGHALADEASERPEVTVTVVETTPAEQISDEDVPLGAFDAIAEGIGPAQVGLMGLVFVGSVGYALYARRCDERAFELRRELVAAERGSRQLGGAA